MFVSLNFNTIKRVGFAAEQIAKWINDRAEINVLYFLLPQKKYN